MKEYTINDCGVVTNADVVATYNDGKYTGEVSIAVIEGKWCYGLSLHKNFGDCEGMGIPVIPNHRAFENSYDMAKDAIHTLNFKKKSHNPAVEALIKQLIDKYYQLDLFGSI